MGLITHLITFGAGIYVGTRIVSGPSNGENNEPWVRVNTSGVKIGQKDVVKITNEKIELGDGFIHFDRTGRND